MHTGILKPRRLFMVDDKGNKIELQGTINLEELDLNSVELDPYKNISVTELSMSINVEKSETISRKKFVKLLMSKGIQRNSANEIAKYVLKRNGRYTLFDLLIW